MAPKAKQAPRLHPAERLVFFTDAVVAIAMTLLILPLMESTTEARDHGDTLHWLGEHVSQLLSFVLSFAIIAVFWRAHHRLFEHVRVTTQGLAMLNFAWMFTIVWLPIATALTGAMHTYDPVTGVYDRWLVAVYIGTLCVNALLLYLMEVSVHRNPALWNAEDPPSNRMGEAVALSMTVLFTLALVIGLALPQVNMAALFVLFGTGPLASLLHRRMKPLPGGA